MFDLGILKGRKTYIVGWLMLVKGIIGFLIPDAGISDSPALDVQMGLVALGLRKAIN